MPGFEFDEFSVALSYVFIAPSSSQAPVKAENKKEEKKAAPAKAAPAKADDDLDLFGDDDEDAPAAKAAPAKKADDEIDLFGDSDGETAEERAATKARKERMELARKLKEEKDAAEGKKKKVKEVEKSLVVLEVKPWEADTDLEAVWKKIIEYKQEGLTWGQTFKLEPVAFGIKKLVLTVTIVDALVLLDDITENIEALEEWVQSVQVASMNKI
mmetsp:Transcript_19336/g.20953  ORF Transcript_19336/g.20953 Transcript_19336/m.20953 type:complete len:214 (-) Transcript_19336:99-740(-)|eukprot:CAMPEP_0173150480 /NCGR_PEP_ID=MMETSP1105-20130129/10990_1 /TAXON_ID=2985 /ORGANISM="Ochromonas sp., Strain BG-1" /LENGTH=213 /DNA_ID=CAMNT_0014065633 /DNA_START=69 /DNA_END=710 /DNA_ORIENTATION=+